MPLNNGLVYMQSLHLNMSFFYLYPGRKKELLERALYAEVSNQINDELNAPPPPTEFVSTTQKDFDVEGFKHELPAPEREHNVETEQPITFWSEHKQKIHVSNVKVCYVGHIHRYWKAVPE